MGELQFSGLATGLDTSSIVQQMVEIEKRRSYRYESEKAEVQAEKTAYTELEGKLKSLEMSISQLSNADDLRSYKTGSTDSDKITSEATGSAFEGTHSVQVKQLATSDRFVHNGVGFNYNTDFVGTGNFIYVYDGVERVVTTDDETTLQDLVNKINSDTDNPGVTASLMEYKNPDGSGNIHLVLSGKDSGSDYAVKINDSSTEQHETSEIHNKSDEQITGSTRIADLENFGNGLPDAGDQLQITGTDTSGNAVSHSFDVTRNTTVDHLLNEIEQAFGENVTVKLEDGIITVLDNQSGASSLDNIQISYQATGSATMTTISLTEKVAGGSVTAGLAGLEADTFIQTQAAQDALVRVDGYPPAPEIDPETGEYLEELQWISRSTNSISDLVTGVTINLHDTTRESDTTETTVGAYDSIEISLSRDTEELAKKMQAFVSSYNEVVTLLDDATKLDIDGDDENTSGPLAGDSTIRTIRELIKNPLTSKVTGFSDNSDSFTLASQLGLKFDDNGFMELDADTLQEAIAEDYVSVLGLLGSEKTGLSNSSYISFYNLGGDVDAGTYDVAVDFDATGNITSAKVKKLGDSEWKTATFEGNFITAPFGNGLQLRVDWDQSSTTQTAAVKIRQGFMLELEGVLDDVLDSKANGGTIATKTEYLTELIKHKEDRIESEESRLVKYEDRLRAKYARMEAMISQMQAQMQYLNATG